MCSAGACRSRARAWAPPSPTEFHLRFRVRALREGASFQRGEGPRPDVRHGVVPEIEREDVQRRGVLQGGEGLGRGARPRRPWGRAGTRVRHWQGHGRGHGQQHGRGGEGGRAFNSGREGGVDAALWLGPLPPPPPPQKAQLTGPPKILPRLTAGPRR